MDRDLPRVQIGWCGGVDMGWRLVKGRPRPGAHSESRGDKVRSAVFAGFTAAVVADEVDRDLAEGDG